MALNVLKDIQKVFASLRAQEIRDLAARQLRVGLMAAEDDSYRRMEAFLAPAAASANARERAARAIERVDGPPEDFDFVLCAPGIPTPRNGYLFESEEQDSLADLIARENQEIELALAATFPMIRAAVSSRIVGRIARENALFAMVTALPDVIPNLIELPWAAGEFATDAAFLTVNQIRMALLLSAAHGKPVGYTEQKAEIAAIVAGAFGWRALARELAGKIPFGAGLIPKAAIAYAGTYVTGLGIEKLKRTGSGMSKREKRDAYEDAFDKGKEVAREMTAGGRS